jgi:hypothetical protein
MIRKGWSYKEDRRLSELAGSGKTLEQIEGNGSDTRWHTEQVDTTRRLD